jgi:hypothetical protein
VVFGGRVFYWGVPLMQFYPWQHIAVETWRAGEAPLWNSLAGNGAPLAANLQTAAFYPLNFLYLLLPTESAMSYTAALHVILAGLFMFAYARTMGLRPFAALIAAIAFQLSGFFISRLVYFSITAAFPWIVAWLWRAERAMQSSRVRDGAWLALAIGLGLLAGHAQTALQGLVLLAVYVLYRSLIARREGERRMRSVIVIGVGVLIGLGLAAVQLLPAAELTRQSQRTGGLDYTFAMSHSYWPWRLLTLFAPDLFGNPGYGNFWGYDNYWENAAYIGVLPIGLAAMAVKEWWRARRMQDESGALRVKDEGASHSSFHILPSTFLLTPFFAVFTVIAFVLAFGWFTPIYPFLFHNVPGFDLFQGPARLLSVITVALCALAGIGAEVMLRERGRVRRSVVWIVIGVALIGGGLAARSFLSGRVTTFPGETARLGVLVAVGGLLFGLRPPLEDRRFTIWVGVFVGVVAIDLLTAHAALNPAIDPAVYRLPTQSAAAIRADGAGRVFMFEADDKAVRQRHGIDLPFADYGPVGLAAWMQFRETLIPNTSMIDGIPTANSFDPLVVGRSLQLWEAIDALPLPDALRVLGLMNVRYIASERALDLPIVYRDSWVTLYRNEAVLPRAWIVPSARVETDTLTAILDPKFDPLYEVALEEETVQTSRDTRYVIRYSLYSLRDTPNAVTIRAASDADGYMVLADTWYPGWRASIDGQPVEVLRANYAFRAVAFPAGEHIVEFRYEPETFRVGLWVSALSSILVAVGLVKRET